MDPQSFIARAEAQRWLGIAEKLLISNDIVGSKTFAIRARESDPRLESADQILAITDTLIAAEKRAGQHPDYYALLQLVRFTQDTDQIADQYRRLAVILNPNRNRFPFSDQAFQLVNDAWTVLSNPIRKSMYDSEIDFTPHQHHQQEQQQQQQQQMEMNGFGFNIEQHQQHQQQQQHQHNFFSNNRETFQSRVYQQHNFMSMNHEQEQLFEPQVQPFQVNFPPQQHPPLSWPQPPPVSQPQPQQLFQQVQTQLQHSLQRNAAAFQFLNQLNINNGVREEEPVTQVEVETERVDENVDEPPTFWTACPYCYYMYEHHKVYAECTLRCDNCKRAFQAVRLNSPPQIIEGQEAYYCWGFFPLGVSMSHLQKTNGTETKSKWTPFSPLCDVSTSVQEHLNDRAASKKSDFENKNLGMWTYIDDEVDDIFEGVSEPSDDSDVEWDSLKTKRVKRTKGSNKHGTRVTRSQVVAVSERAARNGRDKNPQQDTPAVPVTGTSEKVVGVNTRRQSGQGAKEMGKLDLNVEFNNNEGEESATRVTSGNRGNGEEDEDNIEGIGFFEGLDEFFSTLPILSVGKDEKVKAG